MTKKRKHTSTPRYKRLARRGRLDAAPFWLAKYEGRNLVKGYRRHYGVDLLCALNELQMLGVKFNPHYVDQLRNNVDHINEAKQAVKRKKKEQEIDLYPDSDWYFSVIVGYTEAGFPYGITWEEEEAMQQLEDSDK